MMTSQEPRPQHLLDLISAKWKTGLVAATAQLGLADALSDETLHAAEVARRTATLQPVAYRILRALSTLGLTEELAGERFRLTATGRLLRSDVPGSMKHLAMMTGSDWHNRLWEALPTCAREGGGGAKHAFGDDLWSYLDSRPTEFANFNEAMSAASVNMHAHAVGTYDFTGVKTLVDVGGGHGRVLSIIAAKYPELRGIVFDRPNLEASAVEDLRRLNLSHRISFVGGDFLVSVPAGGDAYLMAHVLHNWPDAQALAILRNTRKVMSPGDRLIIVDAVIRPSGEADWGKLMDVEMMLMFGGRDRTEGEFRSLLDEASFDLARVLPTRAPVSIVEGFAR